MSYKEAGVDIDAGDKLVDAIKPLAKSTFRDGCLGELGGFGALFEVPSHYRNPLLVSGTDGVGTKLKLAVELNRHDTIGIDLVAMCANDVLAQGAEPLFFLDYFASGKLYQETAIAVIQGIADGCKLAGAALIGGECAEMPDMYAEGDYDLAGFCVGVVERERLLNRKAVADGDTLIGLAASGVHSNGYSLVRRIVSKHNIDLNSDVGGKTLSEVLLTPTRIYVKPVLSVLQSFPVHAIAHITGGGLPGNVQRILPDACSAHIDSSCWQRPAVFDWLMSTGNIESSELYRTFNCGIGMVLAVAPRFADDIIAALEKSGESARVIGEIRKSKGEASVTIT